MSVVLHVGTYKTGTTAIQLWLRDHPDLLAAHGARFPRGWLRRDNHLELALALMDPARLSPARTRGEEWLDPAWRAKLLIQVRNDLIAHDGQTTVLSAEDTMLLRTDAELWALRSVVGDARIVLYLRDRDAFLAAWEDTLLYKLGLPLSDDPAAFNCVRPDSELVDYDSLIHRWWQHFSHVTVLDYDRLARRDGSVIPSFAAGLGIDPASVGDTHEYWLNGRGGAYDHREPGLRWTDGLQFGAEPAQLPARA